MSNITDKNTNKKVKSGKDKKGLLKKIGWGIAIGFNAIGVIFLGIETMKKK